VVKNMKFETAGSRDSLFQFAIHVPPRPPNLEGAARSDPCRLTLSATTQPAQAWCGKFLGVSAKDRTLSYPSGEGTSDQPFPSAYLVVALDREDPKAPSQRLSISEVDRVLMGRGESRNASRVSDEGASLLQLSLADKHLSSAHAEITRSKTTYSIADSGSKNGTFLNGNRIKKASLIDGDLIEVGSTLLLFRERVDRYPREPADVDSGAFGDAFMTLSPPLARHLAQAARCAATELPILISGASGVGKEVAARWVHKLSGRKGEFVAINCGALPATLIESELFGAKKGAFSGAERDRPGLIRAAAGGTLFLDEVGELPPAAQVKLLRVLQEKEVVAVGDTSVVKVDVRFVAATLQDVDSQVAAGAFRHDLLARIAGFRLNLPTLAERPEDIGALIGRLIAKLAPKAVVRFDQDAGRALLNYDWPLNVRELEHVLQSAMALAGEARIGLAHLPEAVAGAAEVGRSAASPSEQELQRELELQLKRHKGNVSAVAREMGRARIQIRRWCTKYSIDIDSFR